MNSIEFEKKCHPYNIQYRKLFGYVPCKEDYFCNRTEYLEALVKSIESEKELNNFISKKTYDVSNIYKKY